MKILPLLCVLCVLSRLNSSAAEGRVISDNGTNILAIGIDSRDFDVIRFYLRGTNTLEIRTDDLLQKDRSMMTAIVRGGSQLLTAPETTKAITFNKPMPDATYIVLATPQLPTTVSVTSKTTNGFTLNLTVGIAGRVDWLAINPQ
jgi:hypothetical protein